MKTIKNPHGPTVENILRQRQLAEDMETAAQKEAAKSLRDNFPQIFSRGIEENLWERFDDIFKRDMEHTRSKSQ